MYSTGTGRKSVRVEKEVIHCASLENLRSISIAHTSIRAPLLAPDTRIAPRPPHSHILTTHSHMHAMRNSALSFLHISPRDVVKCVTRYSRKHASGSKIVWATDARRVLSVSRVRRLDDSSALPTQW
jgi:hypothetical protein